MNVIDVLKDGHQQLIKVMDELEAAADKNAENCDALFQKFKSLFNEHDEIEDKIFYPALKAHPQLNKIANKGYQAHHMVEIGILELRLVPYNSESWGPKFSVIKDSVVTHINEEENVLFPHVSTLFSEQELSNMGQQALEKRKGAVAPGTQ